MYGNNLKEETRCACDTGESAPNTMNLRCPNCNSRDIRVNSDGEYICNRCKTRLNF